MVGGDFDSLQLRDLHTFPPSIRYSAIDFNPIPTIVPRHDGVVRVWCTGRTCRSASNYVVHQAAVSNSAVAVWPPDGIVVLFLKTKNADFFLFSLY
jgi:hypothetical protein